jgi:hypothetical protein
MPLLLRPRPSLLHCAYCREHVSLSPETACEDCGVLLHAECRPHLKRCPTPGCTRKPRHRVSLYRRPRRRPVARLLPWPARFLVRLGGLIAATVVLAIGVGLAGELTRFELLSSLIVEAPFICFAIWIHSWFRQLAAAPQPADPLVRRGRVDQAS